MWALLSGCSTGERINDVVEALEIEPLPSGAPVLPPPEAAEPPGSYRVGPDDVLKVGVLDLEEVGEISELSVVVDAEGRVRLPLLGLVEVGEKTVAEASTYLSERLQGTYLTDPWVTVQVEEFRSRRVAVLGYVQEPGLHPLDRNRVTVSEALALAGGLTREAGFEARLVYRGSQRGPVEVDLLALSRGDRSQDLVLGDGDVLHVDEAATITVSGFVESPGEFRLGPRMTVMEAIAQAGGLQVLEASPDLTRVRRQTGGGERFIEIDLGAVIDEEAPDLELEKDDVLEIRQSTPRFLAVRAYEVLRGVFGFGFNVANPF